MGRTGFEECRSLVLVPSATQKKMVCEAFLSRIEERRERRNWATSEYKLGLIRSDSYWGPNTWTTSLGDVELRGVNGGGGEEEACGCRSYGTQLLSYALLKKALTDPTDNTTQKLDQRTREDSNGCKRGCVGKRKRQRGEGERWKRGERRERKRQRETRERGKWGIG